MIHTPDHKEYLWCLKNLTDKKHTKELLSEEIKQIIEKIGDDKFSAIVSDAGANIKAVREIITNNKPHILNIRCIAHTINLISKDICSTSFAEKILRRCNIIVSYFKSSHLAGKIII